MPEAGQRRGGSLGFVVGFAIAIPATIFALSNLESTQVEFLGWAAEVPLWAVIALSLLTGVLLGIVMIVAWQARRRHGRKKAAKAAAKREQRPTDGDDRPALESSDAEGRATGSADANSSDTTATRGSGGDSSPG